MQKFIVNVVGEDLTPPDGKPFGDGSGMRRWDPPAYAGDVEDGVLVMYGHPEVGVTALVLADDEYDVERRIIRTYGMDAAIDDIQLAEEVAS